MVERAASAHEYAQKLNNVSAMCIEIGKYDKAVTSLGKALQLSEIHTTDQLLDRSEACTCTNCSIEGCILHSEQDSTNVADLFDVMAASSSSAAGAASHNKKRKINNTVYIKNSSSSSSSSSFKSADELYRRPIRIPKKSIREGHNMGSTLFLIITFNLALAHQLKALKTKNDDDGETKLHLLESTVQLYELVDHWLRHPSEHDGTEEHHDHYVSDDDSIMSTDDDDEDFDHTNATSRNVGPRFNTIFYTNLIHLKNQLFLQGTNSTTRCRRNASSYQERLDDLLSTVTPPAAITDDSSHSNEDDIIMNSTEQHESHTDTTTASSSSSSNNSKRFSRIVSCVKQDILEFEYYSKKEEKEYYEENDAEEHHHHHHHGQVHRRRRSSASRNEDWKVLRTTER